MTKHQQSSIDRLPADVREQLHALLRDPRVTQLDATRRINEILAADGAEGLRLSKSAVNRYAVRMEEVGAKLRQSREIAQMWIGKLGAEPAGEVGKLLNEIVRSLAFTAAMRASEADEAIDVRDLKNLAIAVHRLEQAAEKNAAVETKIREAERQRVIERVEQAVAEAGQAEGGQLTTERFKQVVREVYGV
jgi:hypothetical protein